MRYDYIIVLSASVRDLSGKFAQFDKVGYLGGQVRMDAAVRLARENQKTIFILVGGYDEDDGSAGSNYYLESQKTSDMRDYLLENKIKAKRIKVINSLPCTKHNLVAVFCKFKMEFSDKGLKVGLLTNIYHIPRAVSFWMKLQEEFEIGIKPIPIGAESVVGSVKDDRYFLNSPYISRLESELNGLVEIEMGEYKDGCIKGKFPLFEKIIKAHYKKDTNDLLSFQDIKDLAQNK